MFWHHFYIKYLIYIYLSVKNYKKMLHDVTPNFTYNPLLRGGAQDSVVAGVCYTIDSPLSPLLRGESHKAVAFHH